MSGSTSTYKTSVPVSPAGAFIATPGPKLSDGTNDFMISSAHQVVINGVAQTALGTVARIALVPGTGGVLTAFRTDSNGVVFNLPVTGAAGTVQATDPLDLTSATLVINDGTVAAPANPNLYISLLPRANLSNGVTFLGVDPSITDTTKRARQVTVADLVAEVAATVLLQLKGQVSGVGTNATTALTTAQAAAAAAQAAQAAAPTSPYLISE